LTDPGAVYRRFHVWAEITIDPKYGIAIGKDAQGIPYYSFDVETVAKLKGVPIDELDPLMTEHYRINLYKVQHNKQTGNGEVTRLTGQQGITFDEYWNYIVKRNDKKKQSGTRLANAIRKEAGIEAPAAPTTEAVIMDQFDKIFSPDKFIEAVSESACEDATLFGDMFEECEEAVEDELFGSLSSFVYKKNKLHALQATFKKYKSECRSQMKNFFSKLSSLASVAANKLLSVAKFILSVLKTIANKTYEYLPSVPTAAIVTSICATLVAVAGVWYTGMFRSNASDNCNSLCQFIRSPSNATTPCSKCPACEILQFPKTGCMLTHFLERTGIKTVRKALYLIGFEQEKLEDDREEIRQDLLKERPTAQALFSQCEILQLANSGFVATSYEDAFQVIGNFCWFNCSLCDRTKNLTYDPLDNKDCIRCANEILQNFRGAYAQRTYNNQVVPAKQTAFAQRIYNNQPTPAKQNRFAQGYVDCKTEMHIGARKYAQRDRVQIEQTTQTLLNNSVWIQAVDKNGLACRSNGVFLIGRTMITTAHTVLNPPQLDPIIKIVIRNPYSTVPAIEIPYNECKISQIRQLDGTAMDLALISFPPVVPNRPKILSKFLDAKSLDLLKEGELTFSGFYEINGKTIVQEMYPNSFSVSTKNTEYYLHKPGTCPKNLNDCRCPIKIGNHIDYDLETHSGMCGALLSISNKLIHTKLIGFHVAGGAGVLALGALTTRQLLESSLEKHITQFNIPASYLIDGRLPYSQSWVDSSVAAKLIHSGDCISIGAAKAPPVPSQTQLAESLLFDKVQEHTTKPAYLKPVMVDEELIDPMEKGIKKIMGQQHWINPQFLEAAANDVFQSLGLPTTGKGIVHTYEEAIRGVDGDAYKRPINRTTSPGYPYNLKNTMKGKTAWLGDGEDYIVDNPELKRDVEILIEDSRKGIRGSAISLATLKDEKRPILKVDAGKTRVFEACPQHLVIAIRRYFLDFAAHVMRNRIDNGIAVGINPYSLEWTKLAHRLLEKGNHMIAGDFSNFDGSLSMQVLVKICEKINEWYGDDEDSQMIRSALWEHICNADVLVRGDVIRQTHSQPSGNPLTVIINSIFNGIAMRVAYLILKEKENLPLICDYRKFVNDIIYGDDDIKSVHMEILPWFNQLTITEALASFGLTYTDETKSGSIEPWKRLDDTSFLKRKFVIQNDGTYMAPMDIPNILEMTNWIRGKAKRASTIENCGSTLMELALHPQKVYDHWSSRIREECALVGINFSTPTWFEQMEEYRFNRDAYARTEYVPLW
jgi:V8-like Glu-specific endopeptidase